MSSAIPIECLLGNDLETSAWAEVELKAHAVMLGIPEHIFVGTRAQRHMVNKGDWSLKKWPK